MADYTGYCRSNYVRPKDKARFSEFFLQFDDVRLIDHGDRIGFYTEHGGMPVRWTSDDQSETIEDRAGDVAALLQDGEMLIIQEIGFEKLRYLVGFSLAIHSSGRTTKVSIDDIYELAFLEFDIDPDAISRCSY